MGSDTPADDSTDLETLADELEKGRVIDVEYEDEDGETRSFSGPVAKSNRGGIRVLASSSRWGLRKVSTLGLVFRVRSDGASGKSRRVGRDATVDVTDETRDVEYVNREGWKLAGEA